MSESIDLNFDGTILVSSTFPGYTPTSYTSAGGSSPVRIYFGPNDSYYPHTVTIKVTSTSARFDRYVETFSKGIILPADDDVSLRSISAAACPIRPRWLRRPCPLRRMLLTIRTSLPLPDGQSPLNIVRHNDGFWEFDFTVTANGSKKLQATDTSGNITSRTINADWFNDTVVLPDSVPYLDTWFEKEDGTIIPSNSGYINDPAVYIDASASAGSSITVGCYNYESRSYDAVSPDADGRFAVVNNGIYCVTAGIGSTFTMKLLYMDRLDSTLPVLVLSDVNTATRAIRYEVTKGSGTSTIESLSVNGEEVSIPSSQTQVIGTFPVSFGGNYEVTVADEAGNVKTASILIQDVPVSIASSSPATATPSWNQDRDNGIVAFDSSTVSGGNYLESEFIAGNGYKGVYEYAIIKSACAFTGSTGTPQAEAYFASPALQWQADTTFDSLAPGAYTIYIRDASEPLNTKVIASYEITVDDAAVTFTTEIKSTFSPSEENGSITVIPEGGKSGTGTWQFAAKKLLNSDSKLVDPRNISKWLEVDDENAIIPKHTFTDLGTGWYQVIVRDKALDYSIDDNYSNIASTKVFVGCQTSGITYVFPPSAYVELTDLVYDGDTVTVTFTKHKATLSPNVEDRLINDNAKKDIILTGNGLHVIIPAGTLSAGDSISDMLAFPDGAGLGRGGFVRFTDSGGNVRIVIFSVFDGDSVYYIASAPANMRSPAILQPSATS